MNDNSIGNSTPMDDVPAVDSGQTEANLLDAIISNSPIMDELEDNSLPEEEITEVDPVESEEEDPESDEAVSEDYEEEVEEVEEEAESADDASTQSDAYSLDDLDLEALVSVKIDGEESDVSFNDLVKGYTTEQSLSKKGRELGEARKAFESERSEKLAQLETVAEASATLLAGPEQNAAKKYHEIEAKIKEARDSGDTYELGELKDQREQAQQTYWEARRQREGLLEQVAKQKQDIAQKDWEDQLNDFNTRIPDLISDFSPEVATSIRDFAIEEGIDPVILDTITDPTIVKFVDDYRRLKQNVKKGAAKRKAVPAKKALPTKKPVSKQKKAQAKADMTKARAFREDATADDHMAFLRQHASNTLSNI